MRVTELLKMVGYAALVAGLTVPPVAAQAQDRGDRRGDRIERRSEQRAGRIDRGSEQRARRVDRSSERQAQRIERRGDRQAQRSYAQGRFGEGRQIDRRAEAVARRVEQVGDRNARRIEQRGDVRANRVERRGDIRADRARGNWNGTNGYRQDWNRNDRDRYDRSRYDNRRYDDRRIDNRRIDNRRYDDRRGDNRWSGSRNDRRWDRGWRSDNRYNWSSYRNANRSLYRGGGYYSPYRDWSYRRLNIGFTLNSLFFGSRYWINDPWQYRLPPVYGGYRWIRYYDDVLLVDTYSGQVVDAIYDFYW